MGWGWGGQNNCGHMLKPSQQLIHILGRIYWCYSNIMFLLKVSLTNFIIHPWIMPATIIILNSSVRKVCLFLFNQLFIYITPDLWIYILFFGLLSSFIIYLFCCWNCSSFGHWELLEFSVYLQFSVTVSFKVLFSPCLILPGVTDSDC